MARIAMILTLVGSCAGTPAAHQFDTAPVAPAVPVFIPPPPLSGKWLTLRLCESGGRYDERAGEPGGGAYQFAPATWRAHNHDYAYAADAPYWVQDWQAYHLWLERGRYPWPVCGIRAGL
jgi:hypothetical protein